MRQSPPQHTLPAPHCALVVHTEQRLVAQNRPASHCVSWQQLPCRHTPPQQVYPAPHCALLVHAAHWPPTHACRPSGDGQSVGPQQSLPFWQMFAQHLPLGQSAAGSTQLRHWNPTQMLLAQSAPLQQLPCSQRPAQHFSPCAHWVSAVHWRHSFCWQVLPAAQSEVAQQSPARHEPPQHLLPSPPHSSSLVHAWHLPRMQARPSGQSACPQHSTPGLQRLLQHLPPAQFASLVQARHELSMQTFGELHCAFPQQSPVKQAAVPPSSRGQHLRLGPHSASAPQGWHLPPVPASLPTHGPPAHSALTGLGQHSASTQAPAQQRTSKPPPSVRHWLSVVHAAQVPSLHTWPAAQSLDSQQSPVTQPRAQQRPASPHSVSRRQSRQPSRPHTCPTGQSSGLHTLGMPPSGSVPWHLQPATAPSASSSAAMREPAVRMSNPLPVKPGEDTRMASLER